MKISNRNYTNKNYGIQPCGKTGLLVYYDKLDEANSKIKLNLELYDTSMNLLYSKVVTRSMRMTNRLMYFNSINKRQYFLFYDLSEATGLTDFKIIVFDFIEKTDWSKSGSLPKEFVPNTLFVNKDAVYVLPSDINMECQKISMEDGNIKSAAIETGKEAYYVNTIENESTKVTSVVFSEKSEVGQWGFKIRNFGDADKSRRYTSIGSKSIYISLGNLKLLQLDSTFKYGFGTYSENQSARDLEKSNFMRQDLASGLYFVASKGFYFTKTENNKQSFIKYFPYPKINQYIDNSKIKREGDKLSSYKAKLSEPISIGNVIICVADINKVNYSVVKSPAKPGGTSKFSIEKERDEFIYEQTGSTREYTLIIAFNENGVILWRDSIISNESMKYTQPSFLLNEKKSEQCLLGVFTSTGLIYYQLGKNGVMKESPLTKSASIISDEAKSFKDINGFTYWYDSRFLAISAVPSEDEGPVKIKVMSYYFR